MGSLTNSEQTLAAAMDVAQFQYLGQSSVERCARAISAAECKDELDYGLGEGLITQAAYNWGLTNGYYPVIGRRNTVDAVCKCGCFEANALLLTQDANGTPAWLAAKDIQKDTKLFALNESATLVRPTFNMKSILASTKGTETPALFVFELDNGHELKVTQNHGMLLSDGRVVEARTLREGAEFVALDGAIVHVKALRFEHTTEDVYNFEVDAVDAKGHIIAAEGVLVGDMAWQNQLGRELGSIAVRR
ncbi:Hint domain-containing protein [Melittangium boletus]|uniref:Hint domain-containing protein n=1 Tax=Melittangium boletus TaxID=83453 RepID=UPI003DA568ED